MGAKRPRSVTRRPTCSWRSPPSTVATSCKPPSDSACAPTPRALRAGLDPNMVSYAMERVVGLLAENPGRPARPRHPQPLPQPYIALGGAAPPPRA
jgi:hypothetical protein